MKIAILNDTHFGIKNGSDIFLDQAERFYTEQFFPYLIENDIKTIIHLGDYFDHRKFVNFKVLKRTRDFFIKALDDNDIHMTIIPGNHDVYWKNTNSLNSLDEILEQHDKITIINDPMTLSLGESKLKMAMVPWITKDNHKVVMEYLQNCDASIVMAHLELAGFQMMRGLDLKSHGMDANVFSKFEMVLSGHYHTKSTRGNIHYLGTQVELTWSDVDDPKFFHILDTETRELEPIQNTETLFYKIKYTNQKPSDFTSDQVNGKYVKVIVSKKDNPFLFDQVIDAISALGPLDLKIIESFDELHSDAIADSQVSLQSTEELLNSYVDAVESSLDKDRIKQMLQTLFTEAQAVKVI